jgi:hypothetical protein
MICRKLIVDGNFNFRDFIERVSGIDEFVEGIYGNREF